MLDLLVLLIDKPGHRHQAEGVARVIERARPARTRMIETRYRWWANLWVRSLIVESRVGPPAAWLSRAYGIDVNRLDRPSIIIGSGRPAVAAGVLLARHFGAPFVYSGLPEGMAIARFVDLMLVNLPSRANRPNAVFSPVPNLIDPNALPTARPLRQPDDLRGASVALLLGGDAYSHRFSAKDWMGIADLVAAAHRDHGVRWRVITSRRTANAAAERFRELAAAGIVETFVDWRVAGSGSAAPFFAADALVVTEDSVSMMSEAVTAKRPVVALRPRRVKPTPLDQYVETLMATGALTRLPIAGAGSDALSRAILTARPIAYDTRDHIAAALAPVLAGIPE